MAIVIATTGLIQLSLVIDLKWLFIGVGLTTLIINVFVTLGTKDVIKDKDDDDALLKPKTIKYFTKNE